MYTKHNFINLFKEIYLFYDLSNFIINLAFTIIYFYRTKIYSFKINFIKLFLILLRLVLSNNKNLLKVSTTYSFYWEFFRHPSPITPQSVILLLCYFRKYSLRIFMLCVKKMMTRKMLYIFL